MNGQIIFAEYLGEVDDTDDILIKGAVHVMIGQNKQIGMSTAFPFTNIDDKIELAWRQITTSSSLDWNKSLMEEYDKFWEAVRAKALKASTGIEVVPAGVKLPNLHPVGAKPHTPGGPVMPGGGRAR
jgi:hypothetical protein